MDEIAARCSAHAPMAASGRFAAGTVFGDWRLTAFIGRGGNGEVYCAEHATLGTPAAVKVLMREDERARTRFAREARLLARLRSESFPRFFAYGEANGHPYLAMELLEPGDLPTGDRASARFMLKTCDAVAELHAQGLVHRDIKPFNILWRTGKTGVSPVQVSAPVLADLGLVKKVATFDAGHPTSGITLGGVGTPGYGAPEQMERGEATVASDIHALGVLADRCFGGKPPRAWARIVQHATSSIPAHRYPSVMAFARAIRRRNLKQTMMTCLSAVALLGLLALGVGIWWANGGNEWWGWHSLCTRGQITSVDTRYEIPDGDNSKYPRIFRHEITNVVEGTIIHLPSNAVVSFTKPIQLEPREYRIIGPGTLDADLFCPTSVIVRLKNCVLINRTKRLYPENGIQYRLDGGVYLNFINIPQKPMVPSVLEFTGPFDGEHNKVRFGGPKTVKELSEQIHEVSCDWPAFGVWGRAPAVNRLCVSVTPCESSLACGLKARSIRRSGSGALFAILRSSLPSIR